MSGELRAERLDEASDLVHVLADLGALEEMAAVQAGAEDEVAGQEGLGIAEDLEDFFLGRTHAPWIRQKSTAGRGDIRPSP
jgi:hypothetical protein